MSDANALDEAALGPYLAEHIDGFGSLVSIDKFKAGQSNPTYLVNATGGKFVLRAKPPGELLKSAHQVDREYRVMKALWPTPVPSGSLPAGRASTALRRPGGSRRWSA